MKKYKLNVDTYWHPEFAAINEREFYIASEVDARIAELENQRHDRSARILDLEKAARELYEKWHSEAGISRHPMWMSAAADLKEKFGL